jgi:hypothetical protein
VRSRIFIGRSHQPAWSPLKRSARANGASSTTRAATQDIGVSGRDSFHISEMHNLWKSVETTELMPRPASDGTLYPQRSGGHDDGRELLHRRRIGPSESPRRHRPPFACTKAASLSYALLADVLRNDARALQLHNRFDQRVVTILPSRWTLTRSRILAYVNTIEMDEHVQPNITSWS